MENLENLSKEQLEYLSDQLNLYKYNSDSIKKADEELTKILDELKEKFAKNGNVLAYHDSRIKQPNSYLNKILKNINNTENNEYDSMHDIIGHRIVCLNLSDVYAFLDVLKECDKIRIIEDPEKRDYIYHPKKSGYRSQHVILEVPFIDEDGVEQCVKAEIQLRTIFQDIFAREEHKLSYKNNGSISESDRGKLKELAEELFGLDSAFDSMGRPIKQESINDEAELELVQQEYDKAKELFNLVHNDMDKIIKEFYKEYPEKADILHINSRLKPISSIRRKLKYKKLKISTDNIVYGLKDVVGFKIVCTDCDTVKDFIGFINKKIGESTKLSVKEVSDHLDEPKLSGYRGYKINIDYCPQYILSKPVTVELLIRSMIQDAWTLQQDVRVYNKEECYATKKDFIFTARSLKGLSYTLKHIETALNNIKAKNLENKAPARNLVQEVKEYQNKKAKKLIIENKPKNEE